jgi:hypothetical protein
LTPGAVLSGSEAWASTRFQAPLLDPVVVAEHRDDALDSPLVERGDLSRRRRRLLLEPLGEQRRVVGIEIAGAVARTLAERGDDPLACITGWKPGHRADDARSLSSSARSFCSCNQRTSAAPTWPVKLSAMTGRVASRSASFAICCPAGKHRERRRLERSDGLAPAATQARSLSGDVTAPTIAPLTALARRRRRGPGSCRDRQQPARRARYRRGDP